jgi:hypothetical protein
MGRLLEMLWSWLVPIDAAQIVRRNLLVSELTLLVLFLTLIALGAYTYYTRRMQQAVAKQAEAANEQTRELIRQRRLSTKPAFIVSVELHETKKALALHNIGNGAAVNVEVDPILMSKSQSGNAQLEFEKLVHVPPHTAGYATMRARYIGKSGESVPAMVFADPLGPFSGFYEGGPALNLTIRFRDVESTKYLQRVALNKDQSKIGSVDFDAPVEESEGVPRA